MNLKRCPFCNGHELSLDCSVTSYWVKCRDCGATGSTANTALTAAAFWNGEHRHQNPSALVRIESRAAISNRNDKAEIEP